MNGRAHAVIGSAAPAAFLAVGVDPGQLAVLAVLAAGASLGPDIDHPNATATRALGQSVHNAVHTLSKSVRLASSTPRDRVKADAWTALGRDPDHRGLTHTGLAAAAVALATFATFSLPLGAAVCAALAAWFCGHVIRRIAAPVAASGGVLLALIFPVAPWMAAVAVGVGWLSHVLADACTKAGVPLWWPMLRRGRRWSHVRLMGTRLTSGADSDWWFAGVAVAALALPGVVVLVES